MTLSRLLFLFLLVFLFLPFVSSAQSDAEKKAILQQIIRDDKDGKESIDDAGGVDNSLDKILIEKVDLNNDGQSEFIVDLLLGCGAVGNCPIYIYRKSAKRYDLLLNGGGELHKVLKIMTNGYYDIRTEAHSSASETYIIIYKYESGRYKARNCSMRREVFGKKAKIIPQKCEQL